MSELHAPYKKTTIVFPLTEGGVILGMKKQGFGEGWWNGFGGKLKETETYEEAAARETFEEAKIRVGDLLRVANLHFYFNDVLGVVSRAYIAQDFEGEPQETDEMRPKFFAAGEIPYESMWPADSLWVPHALAATARPVGFVVHFDADKNFKTIIQVEPEELEEKL